MNDITFCGHIPIDLLLRQYTQTHLNHGLADGGARLSDVGDHLWVVEDAARHLAVPASEPKHQVECGFLLDVVVRQRSAVLELLAGKDEPLLIWWNLRTGVWQEE